MKVHAETRPLEKPLAGGTTGASVTVEPLIAGHVNWPIEMMESPGGRFLRLRLFKKLLSGSDHAVPCPAFLIQHPSAGPILVDTGLHPSVSSDPRQNMGRLAERFSKPRLEQGMDIPAQLRARGINEIPIVIMTHLHFDHASAISEFPRSTFIINRTEWEDAAAGHRPFMRGYRHAHYDFAFDYRTIDFDQAGVSSYASFGRTFDLFGDGSIRIAFTPGHSAGHQSVILRLAQNDFIIGGDAAYTTGQIEGTSPNAPEPFDEHQLRRSLQEIRLFHREYPNAVITPGHDPGFYRDIETIYR